MSENATPSAAAVDRMIDEIMGRWPSGRPDGQFSGPVSSPPTAYEALVTDLARLSAVDWPADEAGERIARRVTTLAGGPAANTPGEPSGRPRRRPTPRFRWVAAIAAALAIALLAVAAQFGPWLHGTGHRNAPHGTSPSQAISSNRYPQPAMRLVAATTLPFQPVGHGGNGSDFFTCPTALVCYADQHVAGTQEVLQRTFDSGATWRRGPALPAGLGFDENFSCPTPRMCADVVGRLQIAIITDGGDRIRIEHLTAPRGLSRALLSVVSCPTPKRCVAGIAGTSASTFVRTSDDGRSWTPATAVPAVMAANRTNVGELRCDQQGSCIGLAFVGRNGAAQAAVRTADGGRTWTISRPIPTPRGASILNMTCGDARHCMMLSDNGVIVLIAAAAGGGVSWREETFPPSWPDIGVTLSCATGLDCFISATSRSGAIQATHDGGRTWEQVPLPAVNGEPLDVVYPMICPRPAGCIALAATSHQFNGGQRRVIISNLPQVR